MKPITDEELSKLEIENGELKWPPPTMSQLSSDDMKRLFFPDTTPVRPPLISTYVILRRLGVLTASFCRLIQSHDQLLQELLSDSHPEQPDLFAQRAGELEAASLSQMLQVLCMEIPTLRSRFSYTTLATKPSELCTETASPSSSSSDGQGLDFSSVGMEPPAPRVPRPREEVEMDDEPGMEMPTSFDQLPDNVVASILETYETSPEQERIDAEEAQVGNEPLEPF